MAETTQTRCLVCGNILVDTHMIEVQIVRKFQRVTIMKTGEEFCSFDCALAYWQEREDDKL